MLLERVENAITTLGNSLAISHKIKYTLYKNDSGTLHLGVFSRVIKIFDCSKTSAWMFIGALFIVGQSQIQPKCPSRGDYINKLWYTVEYHSVKKKFESLIYTTWFYLENILSSESNTKEYSMIPFIWNSRTNRTDLKQHKENQWLSGAREEREFNGKGQGRILWSDRNALYFDYG